MIQKEKKINYTYNDTNIDKELFFMILLGYKLCVKHSQKKGERDLWGLHRIII